MGHLQLKEGAELKITATRMDTGEVETVVLTSEDLAEPVSLGSNLLLSFNVFCMFGIYGDSPELETIRKDQRLMLPERCFREFGSHFVFINAVRQFLDRVKKAAGREGYGLRAQPVGYYDPSTFDGYMQGLEGAFRKPGKFAYQQEFRIAFDTVDHPGPLTLNVGDLSDIALMGQEALSPSNATANRPLEDPRKTRGTFGCVAAGTPWRRP